MDDDFYCDEVKILDQPDEELLKISKGKLLSLNVLEMKEVQKYYKAKNRNPTDIELETIAQTWSEHCKHKTFNAEIEVTDEATGQKEIIDSIFKTYIAESTGKISNEKDWLVSVFRDNAGIIKFTDDYDVAFKAETHNHPSALEPYGGANTGLGGVIRDILGAGLGAKPIANTDVFCFAHPDFPYDKLPAGILHPKRIAKGVRSGVRDYGNRMGIPTVNGAILFDDRYLGNPLVYCGCVGLIPKGMQKKNPMQGDFIVVIGGRTGKDGLHGATFSSIELDQSSPVSAVQIGNAIEERKVMDAQLKARDEGLYSAVTDCGAGGFSSAVGELGQDLGAEVHLDNAPLKYKGLKPWEIWLSESQERMVFSVPQSKWQRLKEICDIEGVEATILGKFTGDGLLRVYYKKEIVLELEMKFLHNGVPKRKLSATLKAKDLKEPEFKGKEDYGKVLHSLLSMPNIASKESTIRGYDHEVQGGSVIKPLMGAENDGPSDAAVLRPLLDRDEAIGIANGINPLYSDLDSYWMAASAIDESIRNLICVGCSLEETALLDNFSWGNPNDPVKLGELVQATKACHDFSIAYKTPFISGKDSLYNEYLYEGKNIAIPGTLLISSISVMKDARKRISMYAKKPGNLIYLAGKTYDELGGSHYYALHKELGRNVPRVRPEEANVIYEALSSIAFIQKDDDRMIVSMHDLSEGGLAVAASEMAFAGMLGLEIDADKVIADEPVKGNLAKILFSESNSRIIVEVQKSKQKEFEKLMKGNFSLIGKVSKAKTFIVSHKGKKIIDEKLASLKASWKKTLSW